MAEPLADASSSPESKQKESRMGLVADFALQVAQQEIDVSAFRGRARRRWPKLVGLAGGGLALVALFTCLILYLMGYHRQQAVPEAEHSKSSPKIGAKPIPAPSSLRSPKTRSPNRRPQPAISSSASPREPLAPAKVDEPAPLPPEEKVLSPRDIRLLKRQLQLDEAKRLMQQKDYDAAGRILSLALRTQEENAEQKVRLLMAKKPQQPGEIWATIHQLERALETAPPRLQPKLQLRRGKLYLQLKKKKQACQAFQAALEQRPQYTQAQRQQRQHCKGIRP
jgi:tetratricopeptide (TPR) repeat protein